MNTKRLIYALALLIAVAMPAGVVRAAASLNYDIDPADDFFSSGTTVESASYSATGSLDPNGAADLSLSASYALESGGASAFGCGDGFIDPGEDCDSGDLDGGTCETEGFDSGDLACTGACAYDTSACEEDDGGGGGGGGGGSGGSTAPVTATPSTTTTTSASSTGDINGDTVTDDYDLSLLVHSWGTSSASSDLNGDGIVDDYDFSIFVTRWNELA